jgi:uncharacterized protein YutD
MIRKFYDAGADSGGGTSPEVKAVADEIKNFKTKQEAAVEEVKTLATGTKVVVDELDKVAKANQPLIDQMSIDIKDLKAGMGEKKEAKTDVREAIKVAIEKNIDDITKVKKGDHLSLELKAVGDIVTANVTGSTIWGAQSRPGIIEAPKRKVHMREVMSNGAVGAGTDYYFMKQNGNGEGAFAFTAETATKPQTDEDLIEASVKIETLAGWERISRKVMNNVPGFVSFLQSRMIEKLLKAEDAGILYGTGTTPEIKGILVAGNFTASTNLTPASAFVEKIINDIAVLEDTYERNATKILMRPQQYYGFFKNKASGSGEYDLPLNVAIINGQLFISGVPCYATTALAINTADTPDTTDYVVGDFEMGAQLLTQESMRLEFFYEDSTNVRENKVTVRLEETVALPVFGADYFIKGKQDIAI